MSREEEEEEIGEDERREATIASRPSLQPNFKPARISQDQLSELQELHKRRLKIKSKVHKKSEDGILRSCGKEPKHSDGLDSGRKIEDSSVTNLKNHNASNSVSAQQDNVEAHQAPKKRQKLYWGIQPYTCTNNKKFDGSQVCLHCSYKA